MIASLKLINIGYPSSFFFLQKAHKQTKIHGYNPCLVVVGAKIKKDESNALLFKDNGYIFIIRVCLFFIFPLVFLWVRIGPTSDLDSNSTHCFHTMWTVDLVYSSCTTTSELFIYRNDLKIKQRNRYIARRIKSIERTNRHI